LVIFTARQYSKLQKQRTPPRLYPSTPLCSSASGGTAGPSLQWWPAPLQWWPPTSLPQLLSLSSSSSPPLPRACLAYLDLFPLTQRYSIYQPNTILHINQTNSCFCHPPLLTTQPWCCLAWRRRRRDLGAPDSGPRGFPVAASTAFDGGTRGHEVEATSLGCHRDQ
jgi:hypothetical protein